jgi:hypothetical protein
MPNSTFSVWRPSSVHDRKEQCAELFDQHTYTDLGLVTSDAADAADAAVEGLLKIRSVGVSATYWRSHLADATNTPIATYRAEDLETSL